MASKVQSAMKRTKKHCPTCTCAGNSTHGPAIGSGKGSIGSGHGGIGGGVGAGNGGK
jgi:hypothetical protein